MSVDRSLLVLIADELEPARQVLRRNLEGLHFSNFLEVDNGEDAWAAMLNHEVGLVLTEWLLPKRSGLSLLEGMQVHERLAKVPLVMVTTESDAEKVSQAVQSGVAGFVIKPYDHFTLLEQIEESFARIAALYPFG